MKLNCILIACLLHGSMLVFSTNKIIAQDTVSDSAFYQEALVNTMALYHQSFGNQSAIYNGRIYGEYLFRFIDGHPFFNSPDPVAGSVIYDGIRYDSIYMRYDEISDILVINSQANRIQLFSERIEYFRLFNSDFIRLVKDSLTNSLLSTGFYNLLYKGKVCLLKKQNKTIREVITTTELQHFADTKDYYYIKRDDVIYPIQNKKDLFRFFGGKKKEMQQYIRANNLNFRKDRQNSLTKATAYYDSLKK